MVIFHSYVSLPEGMLVLSQKRRRCHLLSLKVDDALLSSRPDPAISMSCHIQFFVIFKQEFKVLQLLSFEVANLFIPFVGSRVPRSKNQDSESLP